MTIPGSGYLVDNEASCLPCTPEEEKRIIEELTKEAESKLKEGNLYYVISSRWFVNWQRYSGQNTGDSAMNEHPTGSQLSNGFPSKKADRPGQIDNTHLVKSGSDGEVNDLELVRSLEEERDYVLVAQEVWKKLHDWYKGGPALPRRLISQGVLQKIFSVEVYLLCLHLIDSRDNSQSVIRISKKASVRELYDRVCSFHKLEQKKVRIWDYFNKRKHSYLAISDRTLEEMNLQMDQHVSELLNKAIVRFTGLGTDAD